MTVIKKQINDTNASFRNINAGDAKNTDLFLDQDQRSFFGENENIEVCLHKDNLAQAILFIASVLPRKYDCSSIHKKVPYSNDFVIDNLRRLDGFFETKNEKNVTWHIRQAVEQKNGKIDDRFYLNNLIQSFNYNNANGKSCESKFTIRDYLAGGYSSIEFHSRENESVFDFYVTNSTEYQQIDDSIEDVDYDGHNNLGSRNQIFFGAPGTGKSHKIDHNLFKDEQGKLIDKGLKNSDLTVDQVWRTTFHPDYDYAQFVGSYKPKKEGEEISYSFVPQVFAKAYVTAWEKMLGLPLATASVSKPPIKYTDQNGNVFTIVSVEDEKIETSKDMVFSKETIVETWTKCWESGEYKREGNWNTVIEWAICDWLIKHTEADSKKNFEIGWGKLQEALQKDDSIRVSLDEGSKEYLLSYETDDSVHVFSSSAANRKKTIAKNYDAENIIATSAITCLQLLLKQRDANDFEHAWNMLKQEFNGSPVTDSFASSENKEVYLVIEEINRGNCAQIFGDIFQLLDRKDGWSEYPIDVDSDFAGHIREKMGPNFQKYRDAICERLDDKSTTENIKDCDFCKIALPPNLNILATMNTSDQSLFPMDSAFKRRFDWEYVPIDYGKEDADFTIELDDTHSYKWLDFLKKVNADIYKTTDSEDKQMGEFFVKPRDGTIIDLDTFRSKVLFYLWDSVYKDETEKKNIFHFKYPDDNGDPVTFQSLFESNEKAVGIIGKIMEKLEVKSEDRSTPKPESPLTTESQAAPSEP